MANKTPDIRILVGNTGGASSSGESAVLIRTNLEKALSSGIKIKVNIDKNQLAKLKGQLQNAVDVKGVGASGKGSSGKLSADKEAAAQIKWNKTFSDASLKLAQFNSYLQAVNPKGLREYAVQIASIRQGFSSSDPLKIKAATAGFNELKAAMKTAGYEGGNVFTYLDSKIKTFATYLASSALTMGVVNGVRNIISTVKELDASLTDLRIVTGGTREETQRLLSTYNQMAQELGSTTAKVANSAVEWQRQGYNISDTNTLIKDSMVLSIVGFMDEADAAKSLTAALKGYKLGTEEAMSVVDKFTATDMVAASSAGTLAEALAKTAANAKLAGLSLDDVIAQLAVVNETMQESGEQTGTFYNTMLSRMGNIKAGNLTDPESAESLSDVEATLGGLGIKLRDSESEFRNFGDVLDEVGGKWESFSSVQQRAIATAFAGTRQQTRFLSLMSGWSKAQEYATVAATSSGTALEKFSVYEESVEAKTNRMTAAFEELSTTLLDSGLVGGVIDLGTVLLHAASAMDAMPIKLLLVATAITVAISGFKAFTASSFGTAIKDTVMNLNALGTIATLSATNVSTLGAAFSSMTAAQVLNTAASKGMSREQLIIALSYSTLDKAVKQEIVSQFASASAKGTNTAAGAVQATANGALTLSFGAVTSAIWANIKALGVWLLTNPVGWVVALVGAIGIGIGAVNAHNKALEEAASKASELETSYHDAATKITSDIASLEGLESEFNDLADGVDRYGKNVSLSTDEYKRYQEIAKQIIGISPSLVKGYDEEGNAIADKNGLIKQSIALMKEEQRLRLEEQLSDDKFLEIAKGKRATLKTTASRSSYSEELGIYYDQAMSDIVDILRNVGQYSSLQLFGLEDSFEQSGEDFDLFIAKNLSQIAQSASNNWDQAIKLLCADEADHLQELINEHLRNFSSYQRQLEQASTALNPTLQLVPQLTTSYQLLGDTQKAFISDYINGFRIAKDTTEEDFIQMKQDILDFSEAIADTSEIQDAIDKLAINPKNLLVANYDELSGQVDDLISNVEDVVGKALTDAQKHSIRVAFGFDVIVTDEYGNKVNEKDYLLKQAEDKVKYILGTSMTREYEAGNVDLTLRPKVELEDGSYATVLSQWDSYTDQEGKEFGIHVTPILQDGTMLSDNELQKYIQKCVESGDALEYDKIENGGRGVILRIVPRLEGQSEASFINEGNAWDIGLHEIQDQYYDLQRYLGELSMEELRALPSVDLSGAKDWDDILLRIQNHLRDVVGEANNLSDSIESFNSAVEKIQKIQKLLDSLKSNKPNALTADFLSELFELMPELAGKVNTVTEAQEALTSAISDTSETAQNSYGTMLIANEDWLTATINNSAQLQNALASYYKGDIKNWKSSADTKWKVDSALVGELSSLWSKYMGMSIEQIESTVALLEDISLAYGLNESDSATLRSMKAYLALMHEVSTEFDNITFTPTSKNSKSTTELYVAEIDKLYESTKKLEDIRNRMDTLEAKSGQLDVGDYKQKNEYLKETIALRLQENDALHAQNTLRRQLIQEGVDKLRSQGFDIAYDAGNNDLLVKNMEHINDLYGSDNKESSELRKNTEKLIDTIVSWNSEATDASLQWHKNLSQNSEDAKQLADNIKAAADAYLQDAEHKFELAKRNGATDRELINMLNRQKDAVHKFADEIRAELSALGIPPDVIESWDSIQGLSDNWFGIDDRARDIYKAQLDNLNQIIDLTKDMIKQEKEDQIDALEAQKDAYAEIIDLKKKSLELTERERSYQEKVDDSNSEIAKLQARADALALDDSRSAQLERGSILEQIAEKQKELADLQRDHSIDAQKDALDQEQQDFESQQDSKIKEIRKFLNDNEALTKAALDRIDNMSANAFDDLMAYALHYTDITGAELERMWDNAIDAVREYGSLTEALTGLDFNSGGDVSNPSATAPIVSKKVKEMQANSAAWAGASPSKQEALVKANNDLAAEIEKLLHIKLVRGKDGEWYIGKEGGQRLYDVYHTGTPSAGQLPTPKQNEMFALLEKGEMVLNQKQQGNFDALINSFIPKVDILRPITQILSSLTKASPQTERPIYIDASVTVNGYADDHVMAVIKRHPKEVAQQVGKVLSPVY